MLTLATTVKIENTLVAIERPGQPGRIRVSINGTTTEHDAHDRDACFAVSREIALAAYGAIKPSAQRRGFAAKFGEPNCTNSDRYEITNLVELIAGC